MTDRKGQPAHFRGRPAPALVVPDLQTVQGVSDLLDLLQAQLDVGEIEHGQHTIELSRVYLAGFTAGYNAGASDAHAGGDHHAG